MHGQDSSAAQSPGKVPFSLLREDWWCWMCQDSSMQRVWVWLWVSITMVYGYIMMDAPMRKALRQCHQNLRTQITVTNFLPSLHIDAGGFLTDVVSVRIKSKGNIKKVDELIDVLVKKENRDFEYFCIVLEKEGYAKAANKLREGGWSW